MNKTPWLLIVSAGLALLVVSVAVFGKTMDAEALLTAFVQENGARPAGSGAERQAAKWIAAQWQQQGLVVQQQRFRFQHRQNTFRSQNLWVDLPGQSDQIFVIGAHYDSTGKGSEGVIDNGVGIAVLLALARALPQETLPFGVRLMAFGAEEVGLQGSKAYVKSLSGAQVGRIKGMINLDGVAGGDRLYIHSAHKQPYKCGQGKREYLADPWLRDALVVHSQALFGERAHQLHPAYPDFPKGETGGWSDHAPFACSGVPIAYLEATHYGINGKNGFDGYSQSSHEALWDCYDVISSSACQRNKEKRWGYIWHTPHDTLQSMQRLFPGRLTFQMNQTLEVLTAFMTHHPETESQ